MKTIVRNMVIYIYIYIYIYNEDGTRSTENNNNDNICLFRWLDSSRSLMEQVIEMFYEAKQANYSVYQSY